MFMVDKQTVIEWSFKNKKFSYLQDKCMEEMTELMKEFFKARERGTAFSEEIDKEFADASLMMEQIRYCYDQFTGGEFSKRIEIYKQEKCDKLWSIWHDGIVPERVKK